jgi:hypothetical protein
MKSNITVFVEVFNEESRIEYFCRSFHWADKIVIVDKSSTDSTVLLALKYTDQVLVVPYTETSTYSLDIFKKYETSSDWCFFATASSVIESELIIKLLSLTTDIKFDYDVIRLPLITSVLGIASSRSPWSSNYKDICIRRGKFVTSTDVHKEISYSGTNIYKGLCNCNYFLYHITHNSVDALIDRHSRYTRKEASEDSVKLNSQHILFNSLKALLGAVFHILFRQKTWLNKYDGLALILSYLSYFSLKYLYAWEIKYQPSIRNQELKDEILKNIEKII